MDKRLLLPTACLALLAGCTVARPEQPGHNLPAVTIDQEHLPQQVTDVTGVQGVLFRDGRVFIGGQPSEEALEQLKALGVGTVVNLRTASEMADRDEVPFDEAAEAARLGVEYVQIPIGGSEHPYRMQSVERLAEVLEHGHGPVLLHCRTGGRASYLWTAYLIRYGGLDINAALARGRAIAIRPDPLEQLLGRSLKLVWAEPPAKQEAAATPHAR